MRFRAITVCLILSSFLVSARAQLPDSFKGWQAKTSTNVTANRLGEVAGSDAPLVREYGFSGGERREYAQGNAQLAVTLWKMKDSSGSYGLFTFYREVGKAATHAGDRVAIWPDRLLIQHGPYLADVRGENLTKNLSIGDAKLLLADVPAPKGEEALLPSLPSFLPEENLIARSPKFVVGPAAFERLEKTIPASAIEFDKGAEAEFAQYKLGGSTVRLILVSYATPQLAAKKLRAFQQMPSISQGNGASGIILDRKGSLVCFVLGAPQQSAAQALLSGVRYETEVTWNQRPPSRRDNLANLILGVFLLAGFVLLFAVVAGLSYGGIRVLSKKFLPIPLFDRPSQVEIIRLNLSDQ